MSDDLILQSKEGARLFGDVAHQKHGGIVGPELVEVQLMRMVEKPLILADVSRRIPVPYQGGFGVTKRGARYVCELPAGYDHNVGLLPSDGKIIVTHPNLPALIADCETGKVRKL